MTKYENLRKLRIAEINKNYEIDAEKLRKLVAEKDSYRLSYFATDLRVKLVLEGSLSFGDFLKIAELRAQRKITKEILLLETRLAKIENTETLEYINISVDWVKSRTWGNNPHAEIKTNNGFFTGSASGYGYDKESAAVATALNQDFSVLKMLYDTKEKALQKGKENNSRNILGYGSGYYTLPCFEGGVGVDCFRSIFENCGYNWEHVASGKTYDVYRVTAKN